MPIVSGGSDILHLTISLANSLLAELPALIAEVNAGELDDSGNPYPAIVMPVADDNGVGPVVFGIRTSLLKRDIAYLPALACGVYMRTPIEALEEEGSYVACPYSIDVYLGDTDPDRMYFKSLKWVIVLDLWHERFSMTMRPGWVTEEASDLEISYPLERKSGEYRQLITSTGLFKKYE